MTVILEKFPYRYIEMDNLLENGHPDYRIQKFNEYTQRYRDMYLLDSATQLDYAIDDFEYTFSKEKLDASPEMQGQFSGLFPSLYQIKDYPSEHWRYLNTSQVNSHCSNSCDFSDLFILLLN